MSDRENIRKGIEVLVEYLEKNRDKYIDNLNRLMDLLDELKELHKKSVFLTSFIEDDIESQEKMMQKIKNSIFGIEVLIQYGKNMLEKEIFSEEAFVKYTQYSFHTLEKIL